jgi:hypothetical protein
MAAKKKTPKNNNKTNKNKPTKQQECGYPLGRQLAKLAIKIQAL